MKVKSWKKRAVTVIIEIQLQILSNKLRNFIIFDPVNFTCVICFSLFLRKSIQAKTTQSYQGSCLKRKKKAEPPNFTTLRAAKTLIRLKKNDWLHCMLWLIILSVKKKKITHAASFKTTRVQHSLTQHPWPETPRMAAVRNPSPHWDAQFLLSQCALFIKFLSQLQRQANLTQTHPECSITAQSLRAHQAASTLMCVYIVVAVFALQCVSSTVRFRPFDPMDTVFLFLGTSLIPSCSLRRSAATLSSSSHQDRSLYVCLWDQREI